MKDAALKIFEILFDDVFGVVLFVKIFIVFNLIVWTVLFRLFSLVYGVLIYRI